MSSNDWLFCFDVFGVLHNGKQMFPDTDVYLKKYKELGRVVILTNSTSTAEVIEKQLADKGLTRDCYDSIVSAGSVFINKFATGEFLKLANIAKNDDGKINVFAREKDTDLMIKLKPYINLVDDIESADCVYIGVDCVYSANRITIQFSDTVNMTTIEDMLDQYPLFSAEERRKMIGKKLVCVNPDICATNGPELTIVQGFYAMHLLNRYNLDVIFASGKPYDSMYKEALSTFNIASENAFMFGDQISTDIVGAQNVNMNTVLVRSALTELTRNVEYPGFSKNDKSKNEEPVAVQNIGEYLEIFKKKYL